MAVRCFVAIELPDDVRAALATAQERLRAAAPDADVRWADPAGMHLTLKFLGTVPDERVPVIRDALAAAVRDHPPIGLVCAGSGVFPGAGRPRIFWAGMRGRAADLARLVGGVERALVPLGFPREERPFSGHVTLGRARSPRGTARVAQVVAEAGGQEFGAWTVTEVVLFQSHLLSSGARHEVIARLPLARGLLGDDA